MIRKILLSLTVLCATINCFAQDNNGEFHGNFELNLQSYNEDATIGAQAVDEKILNNSYLNIIYTKGNFSTGVRYESYLNALQDFDRDYKGNGIPYRFATYTLDGLEVTVGNYYEQFGSGLVFKSYEEKGLGLDNSMDGIRIKYAPISGIYLKSFIGKSRTYFTYSEGVIRGLDGELNIKEAFAPKLTTQIILGGSIVSRYQKDNNPKFNLPQNVATYAARINIIKGKLNYYGEYAYKINDPEGSLSFEGNNYAPGNTLMSNLSYSKKGGLGISVEAHRIDHFEFRSERQQAKEYIINYIPTLSTQHAYTLVALYPFATQTEGEFGYQFDVFYKIKKGQLFGGKYGTKVNINFSRINSLNGGNSVLNDSSSHTPMFISIKDETVFFSDFNIEINKKINRKLKFVALLAFQSYNKDVVEGKTIGEYGNVNSKIGVLDVTYKIKKRHTLRIELQELLSKKQDPNAKDAEGDWSMALVEYTIPHWFFTIQDMYNWGNHDITKQLHYMNINFGFTKGANRFEIGYGKKRAGIFCVGGVCKEVPSSNGFTLNILSSF